MFLPARSWLRLTLTVALVACLVVGTHALNSYLPWRLADSEALQSPTAQAIACCNTNTTVKFLVGLGPRVTGTPTIQQARQYLVATYRKAGYVTELQSFTYRKFEDLGSSVTIAGTQLPGRSLSGSPAGQLTAPLVVVPNVGRASDFAAVSVKGAIAIVRRGEIRFLEKAQNAVAAEAVGLIIVNSDAGELFGTLGEEVTIPVLGLSGARGAALLQPTAPRTVSLTVQTRWRSVKGQNVIAHKPGVTQPRLILGGHYDSVSSSPGANDNASGTAAVLQLAERLAKQPQAVPIWFVAFDGEEDGLHGAKAFVNTVKLNFLKQLQAMLNLDMVAVNQRLLVVGTTSLVQLAQATEPEIIVVPDGGASDHRPFASAGVPVLFFTRGLEPNYHKPSDVSVDLQLLEATTGIAEQIVQKLLAQSPQSGDNLTALDSRDRTKDSLQETFPDCLHHSLS